MAAAPDPSSLFQAIFAGLAFAFSIPAFVIGILNSTRTKKADLTVELWKIWVSQDYRRFRVVGMRAITGGQEHSVLPEIRPLYSKLSKDIENEMAIGSVEHFLVELSALYQAGRLDNALTSKLFNQTIISWKSALLHIDRDTQDARDIEYDLVRAFEVLLGTPRKPFLGIL